MSDFPLVEAAAAGSRVSRLMRRSEASLDSAWRSAVIGDVVRNSRGQFTAASIADRIRWAGRTVAVAALVHLGLRELLSSTVKPALPALAIIGVAVLAAIVAWQADAFARAWRER